MTAIRDIRIGRKTLGEGHPLFVVAECGVTCNYDVNITKQLIDAAAKAGADAIKFIFWFPEEIMSDKTEIYEYDTVHGRQQENMFEMLEGLRFTLDEWREVKQHADDKGVIVFSTVNSPSGIEYAETLGLDVYKLSSWDSNYLNLYGAIAPLKKPMIIDTGPVSEWELARLVDLIRHHGNEDILLVHCVHTQAPEQVNMRAIPYMREAFRCPVGYSSNFPTPETDLMAVALGAVFLENRLTMSRDLPGHHHIISKEPDEFAAWVGQVREAHAMLGSGGLHPSEGDLAQRRRFFRRLVAARDLQAGDVMTAGDLAEKRPEDGIAPEHAHFFIGRTIKRPLKYNEPLTWDIV